MIKRRVLLAAAAVSPLPAKAETFKTKILKFPGVGGASLAGTLLLPMSREMQRVPGVVLIAGSGPTDRDGNNPLIPARVDLLKQIAELLAQNGIATLRYDKRGIGASTPSPKTLAEQELFFAWENFIGDVQLAHAELLKQDEVKSYATALLGHSEGGLLALAATRATTRHAPYAVVLASTPGRSLREIIGHQIARNAPSLAAASERVIATIERTGHTPSDVPPDLAGVFPPYIGPFLKGALPFDPASTLAVLEQPCLLVHGGADQQVVPLDEIQPLIDALGRRSGRGEIFVAPQVSHNLKLLEGPNDPGFAGPIAPAVAEKLVAWLTATLGA